MSSTIDDQKKRPFTWQEAFPQDENTVVYRPDVRGAIESVPPIDATGMPPRQGAVSVMEPLLPMPLDQTNAALDAQIKQGTGIEAVPLKESMKPKSVKQNLVRQAVAMIPFYGRAKEQSLQQQEQQDLSDYNAARYNQLQNWEVLKKQSEQVHAAQIELMKEQQKRSQQFGFLKLTFPSAQDADIMRYMPGFDHPPTPKVEPWFVTVDGAEYPAVFNPEALDGKVFTVGMPGGPKQMDISQVRNPRKPQPTPDREPKTITGESGIYPFDPDKPNEALSPLLDAETGKPIVPRDTGGGSDVRMIAELQTLADEGKATPQQMAMLKNLRAAKVLGTVTSYGLNNPEVSPEEVQYWAKQVSLDAKNFGLIKNKRLQDAVRQTLAGQGMDINNIAQQTRDASLFARTALAHAPKFKAEILKLSKSGDLGTLNGTWNDFMTGQIGKGPKFAELRNNIKLFSTAMARVHGGARGGGSAIMLHHFQSMMNTRMDGPTMLASFGVWEDWLNGYANMAPTYSDDIGGTQQPPAIRRDPVTGYYIDDVNKRQWDGKQWQPIQNKKP
ncbi:MAG TPA: hypothetical protein DGH68_04005 [Bacteroidetes bacterium]|jgi:hypothetical protein|nr:hypothetical protein [Bacteroidota bacterium]